MQLPEISQWVWEEKYRLKRPDGTIVDRSIDDTWIRVAKALAEPEQENERKHWQNQFYEAMAGLEFLPAGRIIAGAGSGRDVTLMNCYVLGRIEDSLAGIHDALKEAALTLKTGGGIGMDFSTLRPRGAPVGGVESVSSGAVSFMDQWHTMCGTIMSAGARRGAMMGVLRCDHPDIEEFIEAKRTPGRLTNFNVSVGITRAFIESAEAGAPWPLKWGNRTYKVVEARELLQSIVRSTYEFSEPGVLFLDRVNEANPLRYAETLHATNPCVSGETLLLTSEGHRRIDSLLGQKVQVWNGSEWSLVEPKVTGVDQKLFRVTLSNGLTLDCTAAHRFVLADGSRVPLSEMRIGTKLQKSYRPVIGGGDDHAEAWQQGFFSGDGFVNAEKKTCWVYLYGEKRGLVDEFSALKVSEVNGRTLVRLPNMRPKAFVPDESWSVQSRLAWFAGLCDADGSAVRDVNSVSIQVASVDADFLTRTTLMLQTLGVQPSVAQSHEASMKMMPNGRGGMQSYPTTECYRIVLRASDVSRLQGLGFSTKRLDISGNEPRRDASRFPVVTSIDELPGRHTVYCVTEPKRHMATFNGIVTGQCGEQPLPPYGACCLGSINLARLVDKPFAPGARIDETRLTRLVGVAIRALDNAIDISRYPLPQQAEEARNKRRVGLGVTGLADALIMMGLRYGSPEAIRETAKVMMQIRQVAEATTGVLGELKGSFPLFQADKFGWYGERAKHRRNSHVLSIAPTGTISLLAGNVSSGIEPVFGWSAKRKVLLQDGTRREMIVEDYAAALAVDRRVRRGGPAWVTATELTPREHIDMAAACQPHVDSAISKTINCPEYMLLDEFGDVYRYAYAQGLKGCTTYRPSPTRGSVLETVEAPSAKTEAPAAQNVVSIAEPLERPELLTGRTYKIKPADHAYYITINDIDDAGRRRPFELFISSKEAASYAWRTALSRMVSANLRRGGDISFVPDELRQVFDPHGGFWKDGRYVASLPAAVGEVLARHMSDAGIIEQRKPAATPPQQQARGLHCPKCQYGRLVMSEGCASCDECDYTRC